MSASDCPCGRARAGCEYHDPALQPCESDSWGDPEDPNNPLAFNMQVHPRFIRAMYVGRPLRFTGGRVGVVTAVRDGHVEIALTGAVRRVCVRGKVSL